MTHPVRPRSWLTPALTIYHERAGDRLRRALSLFTRIGDQSGQTQAHNGLGEHSAAVGRPYQARAHHLAALDLAARIGFPSEQARAHNGLAHASQAIGQPSEAREHWQRALTLYAELNAPQVDEISVMLSFNSQAEPQDPAWPSSPEVAAPA